MRRKTIGDHLCLHKLHSGMMPLRCSYAHIRSNVEALLVLHGVRCIRLRRVLSFSSSRLACTTLLPNRCRQLTLTSTSSLYCAVFTNYYDKY
mmetsp:Transcript_10920/g.33675  ORF Transcript_10920/g.33675 Transcript_10920/m.33675 type:complete len:92 (-) Transcript_10920:17-292(-)